MRRRTRVAIVAAVSGGLALVPGTAFADQIGLWHMNEGPGASVMVDSAGGDDNGRISSVTTGVAYERGTGYEFNGTTSQITVADVGDRFDPLLRPITVKATIRIPNGPMTDDSYEVIRKGYTTTKGGDWKMEVKRRSGDHTIGKLHCLFKGVKPDGTRPVAQFQGGPDLADGRVHTISCTRTATSVIATVDGRTFSTAKTTGSISNTEPVMLGNKVAGDDVFVGIIDEVSVNIG